MSMYRLRWNVIVQHYCCNYSLCCTRIKSQHENVVQIERVNQTMSHDTRLRTVLILMRL